MCTQMFTQVSGKKKYVLNLFKSGKKIFAVKN